MRSGNWFIIALCFLFLLKGTGVYAMVHCQGEPHHVSSSTTDFATSDPAIPFNDHHQHTVTDKTMSTDIELAELCEACDHCCSIHCTPLPTASLAVLTECHDKVIQNAYFHASGIVLPQERPPKTA